ncbi:MAG: purine-nucleoside phosphorylase [Bacilli bacterium]|jgi:purine-nucleoside phosphorylase|nr:purine-nucleoside phosphorylase [Bacilli bacterium]
MATPHNEAGEFDFAKTVLMSGDPLRAQFVAENYLKDVKKVNGVRGMLAFTGTYNGKKVSVMGHGMGMPSIGIYSYELFKFFHVDRIIRFGTAGSIQPDLKLFDIVLASGASTDSNWACQYDIPDNGTLSAVADFSTLKTAALSAEKHGYRYKVGQVFSSDHFYNDPESKWKRWAHMGMQAVEMESYALFTTAADLGKEALSIVTISDSLLTHEETTAKQRQTGLTHMMDVALDCIKE